APLTRWARQSTAPVGCRRCTVGRPAGADTAGFGALGAWPVESVGARVSAITAMTIATVASKRAIAGTHGIRRGLLLSTAGVMAPYLSVLVRSPHREPVLTVTDRDRTPIADRELRTDCDRAWSSCRTSDRGRA